MVALYINVHYCKMKKQILILILAVFCITGCNSQPKNITQKDNPMQWSLTPIPSETGAISFDYRLNQYFVLNKFPLTVFDILIQEYYILPCIVSC